LSDEKVPGDLGIGDDDKKFVSHPEREEMSIGFRPTVEQIFRLLCNNRVTEKWSRG
jgi:hypothetical protein